MFLPWLSGSTHAHCRQQNYSQPSGALKKHALTPKTTATAFTTDLVAVLLVDLTTGHSLGAAVTAIVRTAFVVVLVVAVAVSLVVGHATCVLALVVWVDARTLQTTEL